MSEQQQTRIGRRRVDEFTVAMPLDKCVRRLEVRHEPGKFWAWDWQYRTWIQVRQKDGVTYRFTMRRVERSMFEWPWSYGSVHGVLRALDGEHTVVIAEERIATWLLLALSLVFGVMFGSMLMRLPDQPVLDMRTAILFVLLSGGIALGLLVVMWFWVQHQIQMLFGELHEAMAHWDVLG